MPRESEGSSMDDQTRRGKRKASTAPKKAKRKRTRVSKSPPRNTPEKNVNQGVKRKVREDGEKSSKAKKRAFDITHFTQDDDEMAFSSADTGREKFKDKYVQQNQLGEGGCGSVFAGYRKADNLPVAIKHIPNENVYCKHVDNNGKRNSVEVAIMLKLAKGTTGVGTSASVSLLDWYDLDKELILVMERPVPAVDLLKYIQGNRGAIDENEVKIIIKQLVDAAKELENKRIFHRDIKMENILIETGSGTPRLRLIDFGLGCFVKKKSRYHTFFGTADHTPPEYYRCNTYHAGPTTVWQVGVVLYELVHRETRFATQSFIGNKQKISNKLSKKCQDFLKGCLANVPEDRPTLQQLQLHPWFR